MVCYIWYLGSGFDILGLWTFILYLGTYLTYWVCNWRLGWRTHFLVGEKKRYLENKYKKYLSGGKKYKRNPGKKYNAKENKKWRELAGGGAESSV